MSTAGFFLLLLIAILCGYVMGIYQRNAGQDDEPEQLESEQDLLKSLGYILRDEPDAGLDQFIHRLDVSPATLDTHLAVGNLLRRKGEISRAIRVHQNLISRPSLNKAQQRLAQLELAQDFSQAGLLDRAERLLVELMDDKDEDKQKIAGLLVEIYQDEREWQSAIDLVDKLNSKWFSKISDAWLQMQSHFYCELATQKIALGDLTSARKLLKQARSQQKKSPRCFLLAAEIEVLSGNYREAIHELESLAAFAGDYLYVGLPLLSALAKNEAQRPVVLQLLRKAWVQTGMSAFLLEELVLEPNRTTAEKAHIVITALTDKPSLRLLDYYLKQFGTDSPLLESIALPLTAISEKFSKLPNFRCHQCGFTGKQMHWLCPGCKTWGVIQPIKGMEGV
ncbi:lipopolysaccharide assembly protein LapB [Simiduia litorea]